jgi:hypothetical protein
MPADAHTIEPHIVRPGASPKCFLHIPKSAGSSVHSALEAALPPGSLSTRRIDSSFFCDFDDFELLRPEARAQVAANPCEVRSLGRYRAVSGHFSLATLLEIADASSISTVLREPRARLLSLYIYWRTLGIHHGFSPYSANEYAQRPLWEFLAEPILAPVIDNQVCRILLHGDPRFPEADFAAQTDVEAIAGDAIGRLDALGFVGVLEFGDSIWEGLGRLFDVKLQPTKLNVTEEVGRPAPVEPGEPLLAAEALDLIEQHSAADLLVYDHVLKHAGMGARERRRFKDSAFACELVKLGDLVGYSAARLAEQAGSAKMLRSRLEERERSHSELGGVRERLYRREQTVEVLREEIRRRDEDLDRLGRCLEAVHASLSWKLTAPLRATKWGLGHLELGNRGVVTDTRDQSFLSGWSVGQVWWLAFILTSIIAATDVILTNHIILIPLLAAGPFCGLLTGRWTKTATAGLWAIGLAVLLGIPDAIWGTRAQLVYVGVVVTVTLLSTSAASLIERRLSRRMR